MTSNDNFTLFFDGSSDGSNAVVRTFNNVCVLMADGAEDTLLENCLTKVERKEEC